MQNEKVIFRFTMKIREIRGSPSAKLYLCKSSSTAIWCEDQHQLLVFVRGLNNVSCIVTGVHQKFYFLVLPNNDTSILTFQKTNLIKIKQISKYIWSMAIKLEILSAQLGG